MVSCTLFLQPTSEVNNLTIPFNSRLMPQAIFQRAEQLLGSDAMMLLARQQVIIFGVGGVGSWCAEALVRTGIWQLTIVDFDRVDITNVNRQLMATSENVGQAKVDALRQRLLTINPQAQITSLQQTYSAGTTNQFVLGDYDYVIDAIDLLKDKAMLILQACQSRATLFSSMGAARKLDPTRIRVSEFWKVQGDPLARALRNHFKKQHLFPHRKFQCVFSDEQPSDSSSGKGSLVHITAVFGMTLAGLLIQDVLAKSCAEEPNG